ncbi:Diacylglycerol kinase delta, partial [Galemys pyrenaicus]
AEPWKKARGEPELPPRLVPPLASGLRSRSETCPVPQAELLSSCLSQRPPALALLRGQTGRHGLPAAARPVHGSGSGAWPGHLGAQTHEPLLCFQTVIKEGVLAKQSSSFQRSKRRYFKLRGRTLYYAKTAKVSVWRLSTPGCRHVGAGTGPPSGRRCPVSRDATAPGRQWSRSWVCGSSRWGGLPGGSGCLEAGDRPDGPWPALTGPVSLQSIIFDEVDLTDASVAECSTKNVNNSFTDGFPLGRPVSSSAWLFCHLLFSESRSFGVRPPAGNRLRQLSASAARAWVLLLAGGGHLVWLRSPQEPAGGARAACSSVCPASSRTLRRLLRGAAAVRPPWLPSLPGLLGTGAGHASAWSVSCCGVLPDVALGPSLTCGAIRNRVPEGAPAGPPPPGSEAALCCSVGAFFRVLLSLLVPPALTEKLRPLFLEQEEQALSQGAPVFAKCGALLKLAPACDTRVQRARQRPPEACGPGLRESPAALALARAGSCDFESHLLRTQGVGGPVPPTCALLGVEATLPA